MRKHFLMIGTALLLASSTVLAQETVVTGTTGVVAGAIVAGPIGALIGGIIGTTAGASVESARYKYSGEIHTGVMIPSTGVVYKPIPDNYYVASYKGPRNYVYTVVDDAGPNDRVVVVDPNTHAVVQILQ